jgi:hypothetical protein
MRKENTMDSTEAPICGCCRRVPVSHLSLDLDEPVAGWSWFFAERNIEVAEDHLGRPSVARWILADLLDEQRARDGRLAEEAAQRAAAQPAVVASRGIPSPREDMSAYEVMMSAGDVSPQQEFCGRPRPRFLEEAIEQGARHQVAEIEAIRKRKETAR